MDSRHRRAPDRRRTRFARSESSRTRRRENDAALHAGERRSAFSGSS